MRAPLHSKRGRLDLLNGWATAARASKPPNAMANSGNTQRRLAQISRSQCAFDAKLRWQIAIRERIG